MCTYHRKPGQNHHNLRREIRMKKHRNEVSFKLEGDYQPVFLPRNWLLWLGHFLVYRDSFFSGVIMNQIKFWQRVNQLLVCENTFVFVFLKKAPIESEFVVVVAD